MTTRGIRLVALMVTAVTFAVMAPVALSHRPKPPPGCSTVSGIFGHWKHNGHDQLAYFVIKNGPEVHVTPRGAATLVTIVRGGDTVSVDGCMVNNAFKARSVTANGVTVPM